MTRSSACRSRSAPKAKVPNRSGTWIRSVVFFQEPARWRSSICLGLPVYLAICFLFHTYIGLTALFGAIVLVTLTLITEVKTRHPIRSAAQFAVARNALLEAGRRNAEAITAMGMVGRTAKRW